MLCGESPSDAQRGGVTRYARTASLMPVGLTMRQVTDLWRVGVVVLLSEKVD